MRVERSEAKYQMIKLIKSCRTLSEVNALIKAGAVASTDEYMNAKDKNDLLQLEHGLGKLVETREMAAKRFINIFKEPRNRHLPMTREEAIMNMMTAFKYGFPINWNRDGNLIRHGRPNPPRPGSSEGKIGQTEVVGADRVLTDFKLLIMALADLQESFDKLNPPKIIEIRGNNKI